MPINFLNLPAYDVVRVQEDDRDYRVTVQVKDLPSACKHCGDDKIIGHGRQEHVIRDIPTLGKRTTICVQNRRWRCLSCEKTFMETLPGVDAKREMTDRLVNWIGKRCVKVTFAQVAEDTGLDEKTVRNVFDGYFEKVLTQFKFEVPKRMGIDEIHLTTNRCVITNLDDNSLIEILPSRDKKTVLAFLKDLPNKERVQVVAMDMWRPYRDAAIEVFPSAKIVIDKFHVVRMATDAMETVRKNLRSKQSRENRKGLMHDRFVLLKRANRLNQDGKTKLCLRAEVHACSLLVFEHSEWAYPIEPTPKNAVPGALDGFRIRSLTYQFLI